MSHKPTSYSQEKAVDLTRQHKLLAAGSWSCKGIGTNIGRACVGTNLNTLVSSLAVLDSTSCYCVSAHHSSTIFHNFSHVDPNSNNQTNVISLQPCCHGCCDLRRHRRSRSVPRSEISSCSASSMKSLERRSNTWALDEDSAAPAMPWCPTLSHVCWGSAGQTLLMASFGSQLKQTSKTDG